MTGKTAASFKKFLYWPGRGPDLSLLVFIALTTPALSGYRPERGAIAGMPSGFMVTRPAEFVRFAKQHQTPRTDDYRILTTAHRDAGTRLLQSTDNESGHPPRVAPELIAKAKAQGTVRVIVELRLPPHNEDAEASRQHAIRVTQQALLDELAQANVRVIRTYASIPAIALAASVEALEIAAASRHVTRISEDLPLAPFKP